MTNTISIPVWFVVIIAGSVTTMFIYLVKCLLSIRDLKIGNIQLRAKQAKEKESIKDMLRKELSGDLAEKLSRMIELGFYI